MRIGIAQINPRVGDVESNTQQVVQCLHQGRDQNMDLIVFPELTLTGYPPEDLLFRPALYQKLELALETLCRESQGIKLVVGYPRQVNGTLRNSCSLIENGNVSATYDKIELPNYGVFDEKRYFTPGDRPCLIDLDGLPVGLTICEDSWSPGPSRLAAGAGARLLISINASPFHMDKARERLLTLQDRHHETGLPILYVNMTGGQDELVFDGGSMYMDATGSIAWQAPFFEQGLYTLELKNYGTQLSHPPTLPAPVYMGEEETVYRALVLAVRDYVSKNRFNGVVIGLSGGIDSALVSCIAVDALGRENVEVLLMPSRYTADISNEDSIVLANRLGIRHQIIPIESTFSAFLEALAPLFRDLPADTTEENIQARCRGILLMAVSNKSRKLVLTTGNKSEMAVGYATLYGDMAGGYAPLKDVSKLLVYRLARWRNQPREIIPWRIIERPPSAELREDQKDADSLPPYEILDPILSRYIEMDQSPQQIIAAGYDKSTVMRVTRLVDLSEYKRRQSAPGVKITRRAFGRERRYPISSGYRED